MKLSGSETRSLFSGSNAPWMLPMNVLSGGKQSTVSSTALGQALVFLRNWLGIKRGEPKASVSYTNNEVLRTREIHAGKLAARFQTALREASLSAELPASPAETLPVTPTLPMGWTQDGVPGETFVPDWPFSIFHYRFWFLGQGAGPTKECALKFVRGPQGQNWMAFTPERLFSAFSNLEKILPSISSFFPGPDESGKDPSIRRKEMQEFEIWISVLGTMSPLGVLPELRNITSPLIWFGWTDPPLLPWGKPFLYLPTRLIRQTGFSVEDLGPEGLPIRVKVAFGQRMGLLGGWYLMGAQALLIDEFDVPLNSTGPFVKMLLDFCRLPKAKVPASLKYISLKEDYGRSSLSLGFQDSATSADLDEVASLAFGIGLAGEEIPSQGQGSYKKGSFVTFPFDHGLYFILDREGKIRISR